MNLRVSERINPSREMQRTVGTTIKVVFSFWIQIHIMKYNTVPLVKGHGSQGSDIIETALVEETWSYLAE